MSLHANRQLFLKRRWCRVGDRGKGDNHQRDRAGESRQGSFHRERALCEGVRKTGVLLRWREGTTSQKAFSLRSLSALSMDVQLPSGERESKQVRLPHRTHESAYRHGSSLRWRGGAERACAGRGAWREGAQNSRAYAEVRRGGPARARAGKEGGRIGCRRADGQCEHPPGRQRKLVPAFEKLDLT